MSKVRFFFAFLLVLAGFTACRPRSVLSKSEMADVLFDLHLVRALAGGERVAPVPDAWKGGMKDLDFRDMAYQKVLRKYGISEADFFESVAYYSRHLEKYVKIYAEVYKRMDELLATVNQFRYTVPTFSYCLKHLRMDTVKLRAWYHPFESKDTLSDTLCYADKNVDVSYTVWITRRIMPTHSKDTFTLVPHGAIKVAQKNNVDSLISKPDSIKPLKDTIRLKEKTDSTLLQREIHTFERKSDTCSVYGSMMDKRLRERRFRDRMRKKP